MGYQFKKMPFFLWANLFESYSLATEAFNLLAIQLESLETVLDEALKNFVRTSCDFSMKILLQDINTLHEERTMLKNQISGQQKVVEESHPDEDRLAEMEARVEELLKVHEAARENSREIREGVAKLNKKIKDIQSNKVTFQ